MGKTSRTKGATAEREVCAILREHGPWPEAERDLDQVRGHDNGRDIINTPGVCIQVKRRKKVTVGVIEAGLREAVLSMGVEDSAACVHRGDRGAWRVTMAIDELTFIANNCEGVAVSYWKHRNALVEMDLIEWCELCREVMQ